MLLQNSQLLLLFKKFDFASAAMDLPQPFAPYQHLLCAIPAFMQRTVFVIIMQGYR